MSSIQIPTEDKTKDGKLVKLFRTNADLTVEVWDEAGTRRSVTHFTHHPFAVERFEQLTKKPLPPVRQRVRPSENSS